MASQLEVAIIGGGPGGLTLARILQTKGIHATIYERDSSATARTQGGTLDIHETSGQKALKEAGLFDQFNKLARREGQAMTIRDKAGKIHFDEVADPNDFSRPEIDRPVLRNLLFDSINPDNFKWGHNLKSISPLENGKHTITFENGATVTANVVVGADGAWSRTRSFLSSATPIFTGMNYIEGNIPAASPAVSKLVGHGMVFALDEDKGICGQRNGDGSIKVYATLMTAEGWVNNCGIQYNDTQQACSRLLEIYTGWDNSLLDLIRECATFVPRPIYALPIGLTWETKGNVTLLGDAAHLMAPSGEGVNQAMQDAMELARAIANNPTNLHDALHTYEVGMLPRVTKEGHEAVNLMNAMYAKGAPQPFLDHFANMMAEALASGQ